jgi:hypothetical protein
LLVFIINYLLFFFMAHWVARARESNVPASIHSPPTTSTLSSPLFKYQLWRSVISSSPRDDGLIFLATSTTCLS